MGAVEQSTGGGGFHTDVFVVPSILVVYDLYSILSDVFTTGTYLL